MISKILMDKSPIQVANVATLPGILKASMAMPDIHWGYGFPIGGVAAFDVDPNKINRVISGVNCYHMKELPEVIERSDISIAIISSPPDTANQVAEQLVAVGIKGILNFTTVPLAVPENVYLEEYDMITSMEKVAYFVKQAYSR